MQGTADRERMNEFKSISLIPPISNQKCLVINSCTITRPIPPKPSQHILYVYWHGKFRQDTMINSTSKAWKYLKGLHKRAGLSLKLIGTLKSEATRSFAIDYAEVQSTRRSFSPCNWSQNQQFALLFSAHADVYARVRGTKKVRETHKKNKNHRAICQQFILACTHRSLWMGLALMKAARDFWAFVLVSKWKLYYKYCAVH